MKKISDFTLSQSFYSGAVVYIELFLFHRGLFRSTTFVRRDVDVRIFEVNFDAQGIPDTGWADPDVPNGCLLISDVTLRTRIVRTTRGNGRQAS